MSLDGYLVTALDVSTAYLPIRSESTLSPYENRTQSNHRYQELRDCRKANEKKKSFKQMYCLDDQHGRLVAWLQSKTRFFIMAKFDSIRRSSRPFVKKNTSFVHSLDLLCYFLSKVILEGVVGGSHGDIAISDAILSVNESCSFMPKEAQLNANGK